MWAYKKHCINNILSQTKFPLSNIQLISILIEFPCDNISLNITTLCHFFCPKPPFFPRISSQLKQKLSAPSWLSAVPSPKEQILSACSSQYSHPAIPDRSSIVLERKWGAFRRRLDCLLFVSFAFHAWLHGKEAMRDNEGWEYRELKKAKMERKKENPLPPNTTPRPKTKRPQYIPPISIIPFRPLSLLQPPFRHEHFRVREIFRAGICRIVKNRNSCIPRDEFVAYHIPIRKRVAGYGCRKGRVHTQCFFETGCEVFELSYWHNGDVFLRGEGCPDEGSETGHLVRGFQQLIRQSRKQRSSCLRTSDDQRYRIRLNLRLRHAFFVVVFEDVGHEIRSIRCSLRNSWSSSLIAIPEWSGAVWVHRGRVEGEEEGGDGKGKVVGYLCVGDCLNEGEEGSYEWL